MKIVSGHGSGGKLMQQIIADVIKKELGDSTIQLDDSAIVHISTENVAFTTDTFTIFPLEFPGGDIGSLAINGTVNDLAVMGATPLYLSCSLIIEEGLDIQFLIKVLKSMKREADSAGVKIVTGDTKVVQKGAADKIFINTSGIGVLNKTARQPIEDGDVIIVSGTLADHGMTIMSQRNDLSFGQNLKSDCAHLNHLINKVIDHCFDSIKFMRDPTRGGVASVLNELVFNTELSAEVFEDEVPVNPEVKGVCDILGIDPLYVANEGKVLFIVKKNEENKVLEKIREDNLGKDAKIIGVLHKRNSGKVFLKTSIGGKRLLPLLVDDQLPRIC